MEARATRGWLTGESGVEGEQADGWDTPHPS